MDVRIYTQSIDCYESSWESEAMSEEERCWVVLLDGVTDELD